MRPYGPSVGVGVFGGSGGSGVGVGVGFPFGMTVNPASLSSVSVVGNALRLRTTKLT